MSNKEYENINQDYGNYSNKGYYSSRNNDSNSKLPGSIIFFLLVSIIAISIALDKQETGTPSTPIPNTAPKAITKATKSLSDSTKSESTSNNDITKKESIEFEKRIDSADLETLNSISLNLKKLIRNKTAELHKSRDDIKADNTRTTEEKLRKFKLLQKEHKILKQSIEKTLSMIAKRRAALEKTLKIKNISNYNRMNEQQLKDEIYDYLSGSYTYKRNEKDCSLEEVQKEFLLTLISKNYANLLDDFLTKCAEKNLLIKNNDYYSEVYLSLRFNKLNCFEVLIKHGIDVNKVYDRNNKDHGLIHLAASKGLIPAIQLALDNGIPINQRTNNNLTPLYLAIQEDKYEAVEFLIKNGALTKENLEEYNNYGNILYYPVRNNNFKMLDLLVKNGVLLDDSLRLYTNDRKILKYIISNGHDSNGYETNSQDKEWEEAYKYIKEGNLEELIKIENSGKDLSKMYFNGVPAVCIAVESENTKIVEYLIKKYDCRKQTDSINGRNALHYSTMNVFTKNMEILLQNGFNPNETDIDNNTPLNLAICNSYMQPNFAIKLLAKGANPNILNKKNQNSLFFIISLTYIQTFNALLENNADINHQDSAGNTPLHHYLLKSPERSKFIASLLKNGANVNLLNYKMQNPLHLAILANDTNAAWQLLDKGANINQQDIDGNTCLHYIAKYAPFQSLINTIYTFAYGKTDFSIKNKDGKTPLDIEPDCFYQSNFKTMLPSRE